MFTVREALPQDAEAIGRVRLEGWRQSYRGMVDGAFLAAMTLEGSIEIFRKNGCRDICVLQTPSGEIVGFISFRGSRDADAGKNVGEIVAIYLLDGYKRRGGGTLLIHAAEEKLRAAYSKATLWAIGKNEKAAAFYRKNGFFPDGAEQSVILGSPVVLRRFMKTLG